MLSLAVSVSNKSFQERLSSRFVVLCRLYCNCSPMLKSHVNAPPIRRREIIRKLNETYL